MTISTVEITSRKKVSADIIGSKSSSRGGASPATDQLVVDAGEVGFVVQRPAPGGIVTLFASPYVVGTWSSLSRCWKDLNGDRQFMIAQPRVKGWMSDIASALCQPFQDACNAESTIGAALIRLPMGVAIGISTDPSESLSQGLDAYAEAVLGERRQPVRALITNHGDVLSEWQKAAKQSWRLGTLGTWQNDVLLKVWSEGKSPLALELCSLMAEAIARKQEIPSRWNPIFDALESKVRAMPPSLKVLQARKKRSS
ncbi:hypothetical protein [Ahniella affigens]|uniref:hypothetical protein n=1 Tax=Ahniella affigens TaxID=2021234 RepID=UPI0011B29B11|nr:hypothetical protein [Ahniella affigens]